MRIRLFFSVQCRWFCVGGASPSPTASVCVRRQIPHRAAVGVGPYDSLAEFAQTREFIQIPFFRRYVRRKNSLGRSLCKPLAPTKLGKARRDKREYTKGEPGKVGLSF